MKIFIPTFLITVLSIQLCASQTLFERVSHLTLKGKGELLGSKASFMMDWEPILDGKFYQLTFQNQREESKEFIFKAIGIYQKREGNQVIGTWFDSRGFSFPLKGELSEDTFVVFWGSPEIEEGKTIYIMKPDSTIFVEDYILKEGKLTKFGYAVYVLRN